MPPGRANTGTAVGYMIAGTTPSTRAAGASRARSSMAFAALEAASLTQPMPAMSTVACGTLEHQVGDGRSHPPHG